ncbi:aspartyl-tRNA(Asn)/glutamyl-tRNA(Gln) amidotransferase subunit A [Desulfosalsimonas propionicica]|uniref:Glutamyl-tRNA(Gln) amidotransferase subunit A n=1 Tax=Desulfosalsimonas propionicica TaxID=332175 RepID=A0A7W0C642_9BACT|nr:Asp-tRNA(Asn)/Glu-tRNA(Gln) amidotransferase subunit GatA [Desulfosalsimonas propionicica]MBA2879851.1 aspartyl-tRNA(Asn)/glutamyl-tRNA(Gln) amidotransferase subunit A [Desulfosalsimonas propionicica]
MTSTKLYELTIHEAGGLLAKRQISARELSDAVFDRIRQLDTEIGAYITVAKDAARQQAKQADAHIRAGSAGPLTGIPLGIKDLICTKGIATTCASRMLADFVPPYNATVMEKLFSAGAVMTGKLNMDEFAMGSSTENSAFQITRNPWDRSRTPGGSSGGSAAAVAADMCLGALGSDTGGSIRQPAAHCGVVGLKPTYGRVSRYGLVAFASSLDQIGPLAKDVTDAAILLGAISGHDPKDSTCAKNDVPDYTAGLDAGVKGLTFGIPVEYQNAGGMDPGVKAAVEKAVAQLTDAGAKCVEISLPQTEHAVAAYYLIAPAEASSNLARYDGVKYGYRHKEAGGLKQMYEQTRSRGFGPEVKRRILLGTYALSAGYYDAYYKKASQVRTLIRNDFAAAFETCDVIVSPTAPTPAFGLGEKTDDPLQMYLSDIFTLSANLAGIPGLSLPCGFSESGLPIGLQMMAPHFAEARLLQAAYAFEQAAGVCGQKPDLPTA